MLGILRSHLELLFFGTGLTLLYFLPVKEAHFSLCPLNALGIAWCPGCGLGHSIHYYLHLDFARGWDEHYLGAFAIFIILYRTFQLLNINLKKYRLNHGQ